VNLVVIESPFRALTREDHERHVAYARACLADSLERGESPYASHLLLTQPGVLDDSDREQRLHGVRAGFAWRGVANITAVYVDLGISLGMTAGIRDSEAKGVPVDYRQIAGWS